MSMNLYCKEVSLWPTPTYITNMCYYRIDQLNMLNKDNWQSILYRYIQWIENGATFGCNKGVEFMEDHIEQLRSYKILHFEIR